MMKMKEVISPKQAISLIKDGSSIMIGGFGLVGCPLQLVHELCQSDLKQLTIISNNLGEPGKGLGLLVENKQVQKAIGSYFTSNKDVVHAYHNQEFEVELLPQGTLSEAIRSGGAGLGGFYTPVSVGTLLAEHKEVKEIDGKDYVFEKSLRADFGLIKAKKADKLGNLIYNKSARNFNPIMATSGKIVIAEVDEIVEVGDLQDEEIITPHLFIDYLVLNGGA